MDDDVEEPHDGFWAGIAYYKCKPNRGIFVLLSGLKLGIRDEAEGPTTLKGQIDQLKSNHSNQSVTGSSTDDQACQDVRKIEEKINYVEGQIKSYMQKSEESIKRMEYNVDNAFRKAMDVQKSNKELQASGFDVQQQLLDMQRKNEELQMSNSHLQSQVSIVLDKLSLTQQQLLGTQQQLMDVQKNGEHLQASNKQLQATNTHLQDQLSLTQQQLLGVQSMMTCSRLWIVSHDQFTIGREIGRGSWASVHESRFRGTNVAAKCLHDKITFFETRKVLQQEMEMALHCQHQNIVTFLGATLEGHPVILMELMDINLRSAYEEAVVKDHQKVGIFSDIASALHFLHTRPDPVIHRDVSSANVLLKACGNQRWLAKLGDLGTAKAQQQTTTPGPGAIAYAAPEVTFPAQHSTKMDVYSFGVLIIETLMKTHPFNKVNILKSQVQQQFPRYHQLVTNCTNQWPIDRPTMYDVIKQLDKIATTEA